MTSFGVDFADLASYRDGDASLAKSRYAKQVIRLPIPIFDRPARHRRLRGNHDFPSFWGETGFEILPVDREVMYLQGHLLGRTRIVAMPVPDISLGSSDRSRTSYDAFWRSIPPFRRDPFAQDTSLARCKACSSPSSDDFDMGPLAAKVVVSRAVRISSSRSSFVIAPRSIRLFTTCARTLRFARGSLVPLLFPLTSPVVPRSYFAALSDARSLNSPSFPPSPPPSSQSWPPNPPRPASSFPPSVSAWTTSCPCPFPSSRRLWLSPLVPGRWGLARLWRMVFGVLPGRLFCRLIDGLRELRVGLLRLCKGRG